MLGQISIVILAAFVVCATGMVKAADDGEREPRANVNFAFGGATTNSGNAIGFFAPEVEDQVEDAGLELIGITQQLDFAIATLNDVNKKDDVFLVFASVNNYSVGEMNPLIPIAEIVKALETLYEKLGARHFVVPNLLSLADLPLIAEASDMLTLAILEIVSVVHNAILGVALAGFQVSHPDATLIVADVYGAMKKHLKSGEFSATSRGCKEVGPPGIETYYSNTENAADGEFGYGLGPCDGFLFLDGLHPSSAAWAPVDAKRIITVGDSYSDLGTFGDVLVRAGVDPDPTAPVGPPFTESRFTEGQNLVQQVEDLIGAETQSAPFLQPFTASETFTADGFATTTGDMFVPKALIDNIGNGGSRTPKRIGAGTSIVADDDNADMVILTFVSSVTTFDEYMMQTTTRCEYRRNDNNSADTHVPSA